MLKGIDMLPHDIALFIELDQPATAGGEPAVTLTLGQGKSGKVAIITLNDPKRMNALNIDMGDAFGDIVADLKGPRADEVGAVVLQGAGKAFSAGGDLGFLPVEPEVLDVCASAAGVFEGLGATVEASSPDFRGAMQAFQVQRALAFAQRPRDELAKVRPRANSIPAENGTFHSGLTPGRGVDTYRPFAYGK